MVSERHGIEAEGVHHLQDRLALKKIRNRRALKHIPRGEKNGPPGIARPLRLDHCRQIRGAAHPVDAAGRPFGKRKDPPVKVVHVKDRQFFGGPRRKNGAMKNGDDQKSKKEAYIPGSGPLFRRLRFSAPVFHPLQVEDNVAQASLRHVVDPLFIAPILVISFLHLFHDDRLPRIAKGQGEKHLVPGRDCEVAS